MATVRLRRESDGSYTARGGRFRAERAGRGWRVVDTRGRLLRDEDGGMVDSLELPTLDDIRHHLEPAIERANAALDIGAPRSLALEPAPVGTRPTGPRHGVTLAGNPVTTIDTRGRL